LAFGIFHIPFFRDIERVTPIYDISALTIPLSMFYSFLFWGMNKPIVSKA